MPRKSKKPSGRKSPPVPAPKSKGPKLRKHSPPDPSKPKVRRNPVPPKPPGGPLACSEDQVARAIRKTKGRLYKAAELLGITYPTIRSYRERWPAIDQLVDECRGRRVDLAEEVIDDLTEQKLDLSVRFKAASFVLTHQAKDRGYGIKETRLGGSELSPPIAVQAAAPPALAELGLSPAALREFMEKRRAWEERQKQPPPPENPGRPDNPPDSKKPPTEPQP